VKIVDLTFPLDMRTPVQEGDPMVILARARSHDTDGYEVTQICLGSHSGTHVDAPRHFFADGPTLDSYPVETFVGPGLVVDARPVQDPRHEREARTGPFRDSDVTHIDAELLLQRLRPFQILRGSRVLLWTEGAQLTVEAAEVLLDAGPSLVGTDAPSLDSKPYPVHRALLARGILIVENLCELGRLGPGPVQCAFLPLPIVGTDGAPVRAVAWL